MGASLNNRLALIICVILLVGFGVLSLSATLRKCATMDEPQHACGAFLHVFHRDYRINPEDPPLWNYLAMLPHSRSSLRIEPRNPLFVSALHNTDWQSRYCVETLYMTDGNDGEVFVAHSRRMMITVGLLLGAAVIGVAWRLGGPLAAIVAGALYCLDPSFLAHASLVKNDLITSLLLFAAAMTAWSVGQRCGVLNTLALGALCGAAAASKFSGLLALPIVLLCLLIRALLPQPWIVLGRSIATRAGRVAVVTTIGLIVVLMTSLVIWGSYGFRFSPTPNADEHLNFAWEIEQARRKIFYAEHNRLPDARELSAISLPQRTNAVLWMHRHHLLPEAYLYGLLYTWHMSLVRAGYLLGEVSYTGWWYYFPLAMLFKTPLATLVAAVVALASVIGTGRRLPGWAMVCLLVPIAVYLLVAMSANLNLGVRHMLPVYPFLFVLIGLAAAGVAARRWFKPVVAVLGVGLLVETLAAYPNYIPFFNAASSRWRLHLLSDSNLDWGQDLPLLADWQRQYSPQRLYLVYFGSVNPEVYGIQSIAAHGGYVFSPRFEWPEKPGVLAISACKLQGLYLTNELRAYYEPFRQRRPRAILGGSIYLYDVGEPGTIQSEQGR